MTAQAIHECDACGHETDGYSAKELQADGWKWHDISGDRVFVMCGNCEREYATRRITSAVD